MRFSVAAVTGGGYSWWLDDNGQQAAWAGESFASEYIARRAASAFKASAATAHYTVYEDTGSRWRWRALRASDKVATSGAAFDTEWSAQHAAAVVRRHAAEATGA